MDRPNINDPEAGGYDTSLCGRSPPALMPTGRFVGTNRQAGRSVRLLVQLFDADLYAFRFGEGPAT